MSLYVLDTSVAVKWVISAQSAMAEDIATLVKQHVGQELVNVEQALHAVVAEFVARFAEWENS
jgi:hypothetical protein